jgi:hypothetical protein
MLCTESVSYPGVRENRLEASHQHTDNVLFLKGLLFLPVFAIVQSLLEIEQQLK